MNNILSAALHMIGLERGYYYNFDRRPMRLINTYDTPTQVTGLIEVQCTWDHSNE